MVRIYNFESLRLTSQGLFAKIGSKKSSLQIKGVFCFLIKQIVLLSIQEQG